MSARHPSWLISLSALSLCACSSLTDPGLGSIQQKGPAPVAQQPTLPSPQNVPPPADTVESIKASHILIGFKGGMRAAPTITRSKEEAEALAKKVLGEARGGGDFETLVGKYSDDPSSKTNRGNLGQFGRAQMVKPFADVAFALKKGEVSATPAETPFGFHIIKRTE